MPSIIREIFENYARDFLDVEECIAVNSATSGLIATLLSLDLESEDEVITTPFTFIATTNSIIFSGARPVFVDISEDDYLINVDKIEEKITDKTKAIMPVHLYGRMCNMDKILQLADKYNLAVIEDSAQAFSSKFKNKYAGTIGDAGIFSFYKTKPLSTFEGGMICIKEGSNLDAKKIRAITNQGQVGDVKYNHEYLGFNFRLAEPLCLLGYEAMKLHMKGVRSEVGLRGPRNGHYPRVVYEQPIYKKLGITGDCKVAEKVATQIRKDCNIVY
jgi:dTDP-4-amino-4,6-dideoxygalactose transaminase